LNHNADPNSKKNRELEDQLEALTAKLRGETQARERFETELRDLKAALEGEVGLAGIGCVRL
jgi:hypothetical protein